EFARIWTHNGMLRFTGVKMSKSLGNVMTIREALDEYGREALLLFFLTGHWRKPIDFSEETMAQARAQVERLRNVFRGSSEPGGAPRRESRARLRAARRPRAAARSPRVPRAVGARAGGEVRALAGRRRAGAPPGQAGARALGGSGDARASGRRRLGRAVLVRRRL